VNQIKKKKKKKSELGNGGGFETNPVQTKKNIMFVWVGSQVKESDLR